MSLVEATIILMVLAILTAVIAPSAGDYVNDARSTKAKEDVEALGTAIIRHTRDTGIPCISIDPTPASTACTGAGGNLIDLLTSSTTVGGNEPAVSAALFNPPDGATSDNAQLNWGGGTGEVGDSYRDTFDNQFITNTPQGVLANAYNAADFTVGGGPRAGVGWRGAYLSGPTGLDPWGYAYQANVVFLTPASNSTAAVGEGKTGWSSDVIVISAGQNGSIATPFGGTATTAVGDDIIYLVRGATR